MDTSNTRQVGGGHYKSPIQHWDFVVANNIPYLEAQIIKYVYRWRKKGGLQDLEKAKHFLEKLIEVNTDPAEPTGKGYVDQDQGSNRTIVWEGNLPPPRPAPKFPFPRD